jgi:hypothetical protein
MCLMNIHGIIYLIIGGFLIGFSYFVTSLNENLQIDKFMLFILVGYVFVVIGVIKLLKNYIINRKIKAA